MTSLPSQHRIELSEGEQKILRALINGKALAVTKHKPEAYLVNDDYSFNRAVHHYEFSKLNSFGLLSKIDSRTSSFFYTASKEGIEVIQNH